MKYIYIALTLISHSLSSITLIELNKQAQKLDEFPKNEVNDWLDPKFTQTYESIGPSIFNKLFRTNKPIIKLFDKTLKQIIAQKHHNSPDHKHAINLVVPLGSECFIWGELSGGFHSLMRSLLFLKQQGYLSNSFQLMKPNTYLIFNGNAIGRGPYNIETLLTILLLMLKNPEHVFYTQGNMEQYEYWTNYTLKEELQYRAQPLFSQNIPYLKEITQFLDSLPIALYINTEQDPMEYIRISFFSSSELIKDEAVLVSLLKNSSKKGIHRLSIPKKSADVVSKEHPNVLIAITSEPWIKEHKAKKGLAAQSYERGSASWTVLSSPIGSHKALLGFEYDAYAKLIVKSPLIESTISLYNHRYNDTKSFDLEGTYDLQKGTSAHSNEQSEMLLNIGSSMALVGGVPIMGQRIKRGMETRLKEANKNSDVPNHVIRSFVYNDDYVPSITRENINQLIKSDKADIILLPVGSPTFGSYLDYVKNKNVVTLFPITGGPQFRNPELKGVVHFRGTYVDEVRALIDYIIKEGAAKKFAFFYQNDSYGKPPLDAAHEELKKNNITDWVDIPYQRNSTNLAEQAALIKKEQPDAIGLFSAAEPTRELLRQIGIEFLTNKELFGISFLGEESFRKFLKKYGLNVLFGAVVPNPNTSDLPIVQEYRKTMDAYEYPYDIFSLEAYIGTSILLDIMKQITPPITKEKILDKLEHLNNYNFKGLHLTFDPKRRDLAQYIWLESGDNSEWLKKEIDKTSSDKKEENARNINIGGSEQLSQGSTNPSAQ